MFKYILVFLVFVGSLEGAIPPEEGRVVGRVVEILQGLRTEKVDEIWPGYDLGKKPLVVTFDNGHFYGFNFASTNSTWESEKVGEEVVLHAVNDVWGLREVQLHPCFPVDGTEVYVFRVDTMEDAFMPFFVMLHEYFHQYQNEHFKGEEVGEYVDHMNLENLGLMALEEKILLGFLRTHNTDYLKDFLVVNHARRELIAESSWLWENEQQSIEGMADYLGSKTFDVLKLIPEFDGMTHLARTLPDDHSDAITDRAIQWRHYGVGTTLGYALDALGVADWKRQVEEGKTLLALLEEVVGEVDVGYLGVIKKSYGYDQIKHRVNTKVARYKGMIEGHKKQYQSLPGVTLRMTRPPVAFSGGGTNMGQYYMEDGSCLSVGDTSFSTSEDGCWSFKTESLPYLIQDKEGVAEFKIGSKIALTIDGESVAVEPGEKISFKELTLKSANCELCSRDYSGTIARNSDGSITVSFQNNSQ